MKSQSNAKKQSNKGKPEVEAPPGFAISREPDELAISFKWFSWFSLLGVLVLSIMWFTIFYLFFRSMMSVGNAHWSTSLSFRLPLALAGVFFIYFIFAILLNNTALHVDKQSLTFRHYPLPWRGNKKVPVSDIDQMFCTEISRRGNVAYQVNVLLRDGRRVKLFNRLAQPDDARYIVQRVEAHLGIKHRPVEGELPST